MLAGRIALVVVAALIVGGTATAFAATPDVAQGGDVIDPSWTQLPPTAAEGPLIAEPGHRGEFVAQCPFSHRALDDPIVHPGHAGMSHTHDFFGNETTDAYSTIESLREGSTTCHIGGDTAAYWAPTLFRDDEPVEPQGSSAYYRGADGVDVTRLVPPPPGLVMIGGDSTAAGPQPPHVAGWACGVRGAVRPEPPTCQGRSTLTMQVHFPDCWDGAHLDSDDHQSHVAYSGDGGCPDSHPVAMTQLVFVVHYPIGGPPGDLRLASGHVHTAHADFMNAWDQTVLIAETRYCVNRRVTCSV